MALVIDQRTPIIPVVQPKKYGVTEKKKEEIDSLSNQVVEAQNDVDKFQAIVDSLNTKLDTFDNQLTAADTSRATALSNKDLGDEVIANVKDLKENSKIAEDEVVRSNTEINTVATLVNTLINKLIFSAEIINKLSNLVIRKKALNPLISDELVTMVTTAGSDANNAVALTLTALNGVYAAQGNTLESTAAIKLESFQAAKLYEFLTGEQVKGRPYKVPNPALEALLDTAYEIAEKNYEVILIAVKDTTVQLNAAKLNLSKASIKLKSLQSGLAAANAAALSS